LLSFVLGGVTSIFPKDRLFNPLKQYIKTHSIKTMASHLTFGFASPSSTTCLPSKRSAIFSRRLNRQ
jgi:hypothetical protein